MNTPAIPFLAVVFRCPRLHPCPDPSANPVLFRISTAWNLLLLCALLCCTGCHDKQTSTSASPDDDIYCHQIAEQEKVGYASETSHLDLSKTPLQPGALQMSVGDFFKHLEEKYLSKELMLRIIIRPSTFNDLAEVLKAPCESRLTPEERTSISTEGELLDKIMMGIGQHPQYDPSTVFLRCFDDTYFPRHHLGR